MIPWTLYNGTSSLTSNNHFLEMIHWKKWVSVGFVMSSSEILSLFLDEKVISFLVTEINRYAEQKLFQRGTTDHSLDWRTRSKFTISEEITIFIALMMIWMSLVQTVLIRCWSTNLIYNFPFSCSRTSRNRFELLLTNLHFVTTKNIEQNSRPGRVLPLIHISTRQYRQLSKSLFVRSRYCNRRDNDSLEEMISIQAIHTN